MRVILTHELADFDALASQLGAWLMDETALPVLPGRLNRNVRAFINLYGVELPFVQRQDLPRGQVEALTLVDTQSAISIKGTHAGTQVQVVDHHPTRPDLPEDWRVLIDPTGATATLFVEELRQRSARLSVIQATLMLLGIYEDTGSLTYTRTTPRDLQAAAYLLGQGANLEVANDYLNHPLSLDQQNLMDDLRTRATAHEVFGHTLIVATGDATEMDEEISSIAHKLRDLLDPDGLVLLVAVRGGVQLVARTTDEHIDAAGIAAEFGGGGHRRAAAAIIKRGELEPLLEQLIACLPDHVRPAVTVRQLMSRGPQLLDAATPVAEVAEKMQRYGYEGYPVVSGDELIGLITRRAVDRALSHRMRVPVKDVMESGSVTVGPDDSIQSLQQVMAETGWGQIPVVEAGQIIGIVTRTDLLKTMALKAALPGRLNLAERLEHNLPGGHLQLLSAIAAQAETQGRALYIVGGFVRDLLLERASLDYDLVVEGDAIRLGDSLAEAFGGRITAHRRFGTAKWHVESPEIFSRIGIPEAQHAGLPETLDLISARTEFYTHPTALPTVERGSIKLDLHRRDFTINTLALRLDGRHYGELHDYWGGHDDLRRGLMRVLHSLSFVDDPTRILRAVRFEQRFGFAIEPRSLDLLRAALVEPAEGNALLDQVSGDRIRHELENILNESEFDAILTRLDDLGVLRAIHPDLAWDPDAYARLRRIEPPAPEWGLEPDFKSAPLVRALGYALWLLPLTPVQIHAVCERLHMPQYLQTLLEATCELAQRFKADPQASPSLLVGPLDEAPAPARYAVYLASDDPHIREAMSAYIHQWQHMQPGTTGHDLRARGVSPGPVYKQILTMLRAAWLDGEISTPDDERALLDELLAGIG
jgi:tRNA nucleotidyltransferase (CCA-adding enzyme)